MYMCVLCHKQLHTMHYIKFRKKLSVSKMYLLFIKMIYQKVKLAKNAFNAFSNILLDFLAV